MASSGSIAVNGSINANGGFGGSGTNPIICYNLGGGGSGGAVRLVANTISGSGTISVAPGSGYLPGTPGAIRLEAFTLNVAGTLSLNGPFTEAVPASVFLPTVPPTVQVISVNGMTLTQPTSGSLQTPDTTINSSAPVTVTIQTTGIPPGTVLTLLVYGASNGSTQAVQATPLQGSFNLRQHRQQPFFQADSR